MKNRPKKIEPQTVSVKLHGGWAWHCAYADANVNPSMLPSYIWEMLCGYSKKDGFIKLYVTEDEAVDALRRTMNLLKRHVEKYGDI